jgi:hypothetical protein
MHIHPPKPLHGWKEFLNEIFVIVIGVLIALGFEQVVEELHWQHKAAEGRERLRLELRAQFSLAAEQAVVTPCILAQLDRLRDHLGPDGVGEPPMPLDHWPDNDAVLRLPTRPWSHNTWDALQQDGTSIHFASDEQRYLGALYSEIETETALTAQSGNAAGQLLATSFKGPLSEQARSQLLIVVADDTGPRRLPGHEGRRLALLARSCSGQSTRDPCGCQCHRPGGAGPGNFCGTGDCVTCGIRVGSYAKAWWLNRQAILGRC